MDSVKISGGVLHAEEIERVLRTFPDRISDRFVLHCSTKISPAGPLFAPLLQVEVRGHHVDLELLARDLEKNIRVAPLSTYADGVAAGRYVSFQCVAFEPTKEAKKSKRIVLH